MKEKDLLNAVASFGSPLYVYDASKIASQYKRLSSAFDKVKQVKFYYAVKALSNISVLKLMKKLGAGLDTVSIQEVKLGLTAGFDAIDIIYTPNGVSMEELEIAKQAVELLEN